MEKAASIVAEGIKAGIDFIKPGVSELAISFQIEKTIKENGGESVPFCIVLSGSNSALPHGDTSDRKVRKEDVVLMDVGAVYEGYYADITRTVFVGKATKTQKKVYEIVVKAQEAAIKTVKPSIKAEDVDRAARKTIEDAGYGEYFSFTMADEISQNNGKAIEYALNIYQRKQGLLLNLLEEKELNADNVAYIGDSEDDEGCFEVVKYPVISFFTPVEQKEKYASKYKAFVPKDEKDLVRYLTGA